MCDVISSVMMSSVKNFQRWKLQTLGRFDRSDKGSVDGLIISLIEFINGLDEYCTTSSCSGRICVLSDNTLSHHHTPKTKNCINYLVSHEGVSHTDVLRVVEGVAGCSKLKFEGFVMHVRCRSIEDARTLHCAAVGAGFRNSGMSLGRKGHNIIVAVRGTQCLEIPLTNEHGQLLVGLEYVEYVVKIANTKLEENCKRIESFENDFKKVLSCERTSFVKLKPASKRYENPVKANTEDDGNVDVDEDVRFLFSDDHR